MSKDYPKLDKSLKLLDYDHEQVEQVAEAMNELHAAKKRIEELVELISDNREAQLCTWTTADGVTRAIHDVEDDHLKNILQYIVNSGRKVPPIVRAEAKRREFDIPTEYKTIDYDKKVRQIQEGEIIENGYDPLLDGEVPF